MQEHGADAAGGEPLDPVGQFVVDVAGLDHGPFALGPGPVLDAAEDAALASAEFVEDIGFHSKASVDRGSEDVILPPLFPDHRGFSSFFAVDEAQGLQITLGSGLRRPGDGILPAIRDKVAGR